MQQTLQLCAQGWHLYRLLQEGCRQRAARRRQQHAIESLPRLKPVELMITIAEQDAQ